jgi:hypothetical protein
VSHVLSCRCGTVKGVVAESAKVNRCVCYCRDCQAFAHHLGQAGQVLDADGGSDVIQTVPANVTITQGQSKLACIRLSPKGLLRWYASCCNTPIGNTPPTFKVSFVGLVHSCLDGGGESLDASFGPVRCWGFTDSARRPPAVKSTSLVAFLMRLVPMILAARLTGRYQTTPFFSAVTGVPVVTPHVLTAAERERAYQLVDQKA